MTTEEKEETPPTMLGEQQLTALYNWLSKVNSTSTFKFIVTSVPFTSLWIGDAQVDTWAGYAKEKEEVLEVLQTVPNVIFISGDRHEFAAVEFDSGGQNLVREFSTRSVILDFLLLFQC